ncbi:MAG: serine hydrolase domain-containing protein, partial [Desulfobacterales bacterium]
MKKSRRNAGVRLGIIHLALLFIFVCSVSGGRRDANAGQSSSETSTVAAYEERITKGVKKGLIYECAIIIGQDNEVLFQKSYGQHMKKGGVFGHKKVPASLNAIYDLASVTKPVATATSILVLVDMGKIRIKDKIVEFMPEFKGTDKEDITVLQLLTHTSGFKYDTAHTKIPANQRFVKYAKSKTLSKSKNNKMSYSGVNFALLQIIVERVSGETLDMFSTKYVFTPLMMKDTMYNPPKTLMHRLAPNKNKDGSFVWGKSMAGMNKVTVSGGTGLFSTASDLARYCKMIINQGELDGVRILKKETCSRMIAEKMGWWYFAKDGQSVFHPGGTGNMIYIN